MDIEFKINDWVSIVRFPNHEPVQIKELKDDGYILSTNLFAKSEYLTKWEPKEGEWCWFYDDNGIVQLGKLIEIIGECYKVYLNSDNTDIFCYCEPFFGKLPSFYIN